MFTGKLIRRLRQEKGLTQAQLAEKLTDVVGRHVFQQQIQSMESGVRNIRLNELKALAEIFNVPYESIIEYGGHPHSFTCVENTIIEFEGEYPTKIQKEDGTLRITFTKGQ